MKDLKPLGEKFATASPSPVFLINSKGIAQTPEMDNQWSEPRHRVPREQGSKSPQQRPPLAVAACTCPPGTPLSKVCSYFSFPSISVLRDECKYQDYKKQKQKQTEHGAESTPQGRTHPAQLPSPWQAHFAGNSCPSAWGGSPSNQLRRRALGVPRPHQGPRDRRGRRPVYYSSLPVNPPSVGGSRCRQTHPPTRLTFLLLLQGVHAGKVAGQRLEGGGEAAPALGALHGAPRALPAHLGRGRALPAVQDARRLGGWGAAPAALRGPGWGRARPRGSGGRLPGRARPTRGCRGGRDLHLLGRGQGEGRGRRRRRRRVKTQLLAGGVRVPPGGRRGSRRLWLQEARCPPRRELPLMLRGPPISSRRGAAGARSAGSRPLGRVARAAASRSRSRSRPARFGRRRARNGMQVRRAPQVGNGARRLLIVTFPPLRCTCSIHAPDAATRNTGIPPQFITQKLPSF